MEIMFLYLAESGKMLIQVDCEILHMYILIPKKTMLIY